MKNSMKDITDTVNDVCTDCCYVMGYNYVHAGRVPHGRLLFVWDITITSALLHVPYKSELIIT